MEKEEKKQRKLKRQRLRELKKAREIMTPAEYEAFKRQVKEKKKMAIMFQNLPTEPPDVGDRKNGFMQMTAAWSSQLNLSSKFHETAMKRNERREKVITKTLAKN